MNVTVAKGGNRNMLTYARIGAGFKTFMQVKFLFH